MILLALLKLLLVIFAMAIPIITGLLLIKHREVIAYFKDSFTFIRDDYSSEYELADMSFFSGLSNVFSYGVKMLTNSQAPTHAAEDKTTSPHRLLIVTGQLMIIGGLLGIFLVITGTIWMMMNSQISVDIY